MGQVTLHLESEFSRREYPYLALMFFWSSANTLSTSTAGGIPPAKPTRRPVQAASRQLGTSANDCPQVRLGYLIYFSHNMTREKNDSLIEV